MSSLGTSISELKAQHLLIGTVLKGGAVKGRPLLEPLSMLSTLDHTEIMLQLLLGVSINEN